VCLLVREPKDFARLELDFFEHPLLLFGKHGWKYLRCPALRNCREDQRHSLIWLSHGKPNLGCGPRIRGRFYESELLTERFCMRVNAPLEQQLLGSVASTGRL